MTSAHASFTTLDTDIFQFTDLATGALSLLMRFNVTATEDTRIGGFGACSLRIFTRLNA